MPIVDMTIAELVAKLSAFPPNARVKIPDRWDAEKETALVNIEYSEKWNVVYLGEAERP